MTLNIKAGTFAINAGLGNQAITGVGFLPKLVLFYPTKRTSTGIGVHAFSSFGAAVSSTSRFAVHSHSEDNVDPTDCNRRSTVSACITFLIQGTVNIDYEADFVSMDADGFTINVTNAPVAAYEIGYLALGGSDITNVALGSETTRTSVGVKATAGLGFQPDALILPHAETLTPTDNLAGSAFGLGAASSPSDEGAYCLASRTGAATSTNWRWQETDACLLMIDPTGGIQRQRADLNSFDAGGFTLNYTVSIAPAIVFFYIAIKGSTDFQAFVGNIPTETNITTFSEVGVGFMPLGGMFWSHCNPTAAGIQNDVELSLGAVTDVGEKHVNGCTDEHNQPISDADNFFSDVLIYQNYDFNQTQEGAIDFSSWDVDGFTLNQTDADPAQNEMLYIVFGGIPPLTEVTPIAVTMRLDAERPGAGTTPIILLDQPTCDIDTPGLAEYKVRLKNQSGTYVAEFDNWVSLVFTHKVNNRGTIRFEVDGGDPRTDLFVLDGQIEVWRRNPIVDLDWYIEWEGFFRSNNDLYEQNDNNKYVAFGFSYLDLARRAEIKYDAGSAEADKSGVGETVMKEYVPENIGALALISNGRAADNGMPGLSIEADLGNGLTWDGARADKNLQQTLQEIGIATGIDFDIIGVGAALFQFVTYDGQKTDRTKGNTDDNPPVVFSLGYGNMIVPVLSKNRSTEITAVYALGKGIDSARQVALEESADATDSPWNRIEKTISASNTFGDNLTSAAQETLEKNKFDPKFNFTMLQQKPAYYGKHFTWGDRITAEYKGEEFDKKITQVQINVSAQAAGESISIKFADN